jgi:hypothetical protein
MDIFPYKSIFGEILYHGGTAEGYFRFHKENPDGTLEDYLNEIKEAKNDESNSSINAERFDSIGNHKRG